MEQIGYKEHRVVPIAAYIPKLFMFSSGDVAVAMKTAHVVSEVTSMALDAFRQAQMKRNSSDAEIESAS